MVDLYEPQDVTKKYPQPPFKPQQQSVPGSIFDMDPRPDHAETSYVGTGFDTDVWNDLVSLNLSTLFWLTKAAKPHFGPGSSIITTSSVQGFTPSAELVEYAVTKAGIANFTRAMAAQLAPEGIRVNGVAPGPIWTPLQPSSVPNEKIEEFGGETPLARPGQPVELASTYVYLASQESSYTTGETIAVTGGMPVT